MKFVGAINSIVGGLMAIIGLSVTCFIGSILGSSVNYTGWELIGDDLSLNGFVMFRLFAIIGLIFGIIAILYGLFLLLVDLKVIKIKAKSNLNLINNVLLSIFVLCTLLAFIGVGVMAGDATTSVIKAHIGVGAYLMFIIPAVLCLCNWLFARKASK